MIVQEETTGQRQLLALVGQLLDRLNALEDRVADLEEWLEEVAEDMIERTAGGT